MEYVLFFWFAWMLWIVVTFLMQRTKRQAFLGAAILLLMIHAPMSLSLGVAEWSAGYGIIIVLACVWTGILPNAYKWKVIILAVALMLLYASFQLMVWYNPVIFLLGETWVPAAVLSFVTVFSHGHAESRYPLILLAFAFGELIAAVTVMPLTGNLYLADAFFYNTLSAVLTLLVCWHLLEQLAWKLVGMSNVKRSSGLPL
ncbi:hypothetical protein EPH95_01095 [Salicibibacter halophilus]|uniref:Uncharacterized protein n=1 Tax=Salicibibacter halophilus TaxID=2502791 RepID=A0A514LEE4_9BACI|nr:hypothetical protein [Salicibibacter halophilus]QDI89935.1 hypothetical protein EPH95_01095 [Salicibibacter halophilus]